MKKIKILLITSMPWREDNNIGNSYSNLFGDIDNFEIAHIYCQDGEPFNKKVKRYYQISEKKLIKSIFNSKIKTGKSFICDASNNESIEKNHPTFNKAKLLRWELLFLIRDLIWAIGHWKTNDLYKFVEDFNPDIIFGTLTYMPNINILMTDLHKRYNKPIVLYSWDDVYSLKHHSYNPLFWIRKIYQRYYIRKNVANAKFLYTITEEMQKEYATYFNKKCKLLYKGYDFEKGMPIKKQTLQKPYKLVFMGNIGAGRWKALAEMVKVLTKINKEKTVATLDIYTLSPRTNDMINKLSIPGVSELKDKAPQNKILEIQNKADILVHVEPINSKDASFYRLSFSTKIVDYLYNAKCIIGIGYETASLSYIRNHKCGIVINDIDSIEKNLIELFNDPNKILLYGKNSWECGKKNHSREDIKNILINDISSLI